MVLRTGAPLTLKTAYSLRLLHESQVLDEEIDALGHMNVRFYGARALASTSRLLEELGLTVQERPELADCKADLPQLFTRYHREQHAGAALEVHGGVLAVGESGVRLYHELRNPERDELAASFVHDVEFRRTEGVAARTIPEAVRTSLRSSCIDLPEHGAPRTLDLDAPPVAPDFRDALESGLAFRLARRIEPDVCDDAGRLSPEMQPFYMWGGEPVPPAAALDGPPLITLADGAKMGWASMENRSVAVRALREGMLIQTFAATVELARKTNLRRYWIYDVESEDLLLSNEVVELALHLGERRALEIPSEIRAEMEEKLRSDLR